MWPCENLPRALPNRFQEAARPIFSRWGTLLNSRNILVE